MDRLLFGSAIAPGGRRPGLCGAGGRAGAGRGGAAEPRVDGGGIRSPGRARAGPAARARRHGAAGPGRAGGGRRAPGRGRPAGHLDPRRTRRHRAAVRAARGGAGRSCGGRGGCPGGPRAVPRTLARRATRTGGGGAGRRRLRRVRGRPGARAPAPRGGGRHELGCRDLSRAVPGLRRRAGVDRGGDRRPARGHGVRARPQRRGQDDPDARTDRRASAPVGRGRGGRVAPRTWRSPTARGWISRSARSTWR